MADASPDEPEATGLVDMLAKLDGLPADAVVRVTVGFVKATLGEYGLGMPGQLSAAQAGEVLEAASAFLGSIAASLLERAADEQWDADDDAPELLSPAIRKTFTKSCAPASPDGLARAICDYRLAHLVLPQIGAPLVAWNDPAAGARPSPATVRADILRVINAAHGLREAMKSASGEALGRVSCVPYEAGGTINFANTIFEQLGELAGHAETALDELGAAATPGRTVSPKTRLALWLGDFLASSGVPVVVDGKPSHQWALAYDLALEAAGDGPCPHARKTLQNAIALRRKERMPPAA